MDSASAFPKSAHPLPYLSGCLLMALELFCEVRCDLILGPAVCDQARSGAEDSCNVAVMKA
jgi:hypothetical protein